MVNVVKFWTLILFCFQNKVVIQDENHKMLARIANSEDPDQTASEEVWSASALFIYAFLTNS